MKNISGSKNSQKTVFGIINSQFPPPTSFDTILYVRSIYKHPFKNCCVICFIGSFAWRYVTCYINGKNIECLATEKISVTKRAHKKKKKMELYHYSNILSKKKHIAEKAQIVNMTTTPIWVDFHSVHFHFLYVGYFSPLRLLSKYHVFNPEVAFFIELSIIEKTPFDQNVFIRFPIGISSLFSIFQSPSLSLFL